jgi:hypothetical protein
VDAGLLALKHGSLTVDTLCYYYDATTQTNLTSCGTAYACEGAPVSNLPHNNTAGGTSNTDSSLERKPGGASGNTTDTNVNSADFSTNSTPIPRNLSSAAVP